MNHSGRMPPFLDSRDASQVMMAKALLAEASTSFCSAYAIAVALVAAFVFQMPRFFDLAKNAVVAFSVINCTRPALIFYSSDSQLNP